MLCIIAIIQLAAAKFTLGDNPYESGPRSVNLGVVAN